MDMKVSGYGIIKPATVRRRSGTGAAASFSDILGAAEAEGSYSPQETSEVAHAASLGGLLALQEISEEERKRERLVKQGKTMLDTLDTLRQRLLMGEIPAHMLSSLSASLSTQKEGVSDPRLLAIIEEIELRVAVELAKLEMSFAARAEI